MELTNKNIYDTNSCVHINGFILPKLNVEILCAGIKELSDKTFKVWTFHNLMQECGFLNSKKIKDYFNLTTEEYHNALEELIEKGYYTTNEKEG